jgi:hypothetical protein
MRSWLLPIVVLAILAVPALVRPAEITDVIDAADGDDPIDINIDISFRSTLNRSKITHEWQQAWTQPGQGTRPDYNELRFDQTTYAMDYMVEVGLFHDLQLYINLPWVIQDKKKIDFVNGVAGDGSAASLSTLYRNNPGADFQNAVAVDPATNPSAERAGIGDMQLGIKWAVFNDARDDTKSVWIIGLDYTIPSGGLAKPEQVAGGAEGSVGMGHHILTPFMLFSHRFSVLDPYIGIQGSLPIQGREAKNNGLRMPYHGGFLTGLEIIPWESSNKHQKFSIDVRLWTTFFGEVESKGRSSEQGTVNEMSDFLVSPSTSNGQRQYQATGQYTQFGLLLGFAFRAAEFVKLRFGVSLAHNTEHFLTGADFCEDNDSDGNCDSSVDLENIYRAPIYDDPGRRLRVEETTLFTWWVTAMATF